MKKRLFLIIQAIEKIYNGVISFSYRDEDNANIWYVAIDDYDIYMSEKFKELCNRWRKKVISENRIVFIYLKPNEDRLFSLCESGNLILNKI